MQMARVNRLSVDRVVRAAILAIAAAFALSLGGRYDWRLDLFSHWRLQYLFTAGLLLPLLLWRRHHFSALLAALVVLSNVTTLHSTPQALTAKASEAQIASGDRRIRLAHFNLLVSNRSYGRTIEWLRQVRPDVLVLVEYTERWGAAMRSLDGEFPHRIAEPDNEGGGIAIYSRYPFRKAIPYRVGYRPRTALDVTFAVAGAELTVIAAHPWPPISSAKARDQERYLGLIESLARQASGPLVVSGDLNTTPWSHVFTDFVKAGGFVEREVLPTWPAGLGALGIPIDHVLGRGLNIEAIGAGPRLGSDHRPLVADIRF